MQKWKNRKILEKSYKTVAKTPQLAVGIKPQKALYNDK